MSPQEVEAGVSRLRSEASQWPVLTASTPPVCFVSGVSSQEHDSCLDKPVLLKL